MTSDEDGTIVTFRVPTGQRSVRSLDVALIIDDSGSTVSTDPRNHRYVAAQRLAMFLGWQAAEKARAPRSREGRRLRPTGFDDTIGVVHFADQAGPILPLTSASRGLAQVMHALKPATTGGTSLTAGLSAGAVLLEHSGEAVAIIYTDGDLSESDAELTTALRHFPPDVVHLVAFSVGGIAASGIQRWNSLPFGSVTAVDSMGTRGVEWAYAKPVVEALGYTWDGPTVPADPHTPISRRKR